IMKNILYAFLLVSGLFLGSCSKDGDTDAPEIEVFEPEENQVVKIGSNLNMKFKFKDDYGVRFYSYQIYHSIPNTLGEFNYKKEIEVNVPANEFEISPSVMIPIINKDSIPTAVGDYTLRVIAVDWYSKQTVIDRTIKIEQNQSNN